MGTGASAASNGASSGDEDVRADAVVPATDESADDDNGSDDDNGEASEDDGEAAMELEGPSTATAAPSAAAAVAKSPRKEHSPAALKSNKSLVKTASAADLRKPNTAASTATATSTSIARNKTSTAAAPTANKLQKSTSKTSLSVSRPSTATSALSNAKGSRKEDSSKASDKVVNAKPATAAHGSKVQSTQLVGKSDKLKKSTTTEPANGSKHTSTASTTNAVKPTKLTSSVSAPSLKPQVQKAPVRPVLGTTNPDKTIVTSGSAPARPSTGKTTTPESKAQKIVTTTKSVKPGVAGFNSGKSSFLKKVTNKK